MFKTDFSGSLKIHMNSGNYENDFLIAQTL